MFLSIIQEDVTPWYTTYKYIFFIFKNDLIEIIINNKEDEEDDANTLIIVHGQSFVLSLPLSLSAPPASGGMASNHTAERVCGHHLL